MRRLRRRLAAQERELARLRAEVAAWRAAAAGAPRRGPTATSPRSPAARSSRCTPRSTSRPTSAPPPGFPGEFPFTRGIHPTMYRGRLWTMRQFAGFGTAEDTNERYKFLLERGQTGLSVAFDFPTLMGYDSDHPRSEGEVGKCGVAISSLADMETLFDGIPLDQVSTSMTINGPAAMLFCFYVAAAERQGVPIAQLQGTIQNDILKEYMAQHAWIFPAEPALKIIVDLFEWAAEHTPKWNTISISGYHIREAGATAAQELAFTLANGFCYVEHGLARGLDVDAFAPAALVLLGRPQRLLRGDRQAPRRAADLGPAHARALRRAGPAELADAVPLPDGRRHAHRAAAAQQRGPGGLPGAGRGARRHPVAPHQRARRDARAAHRGVGPHRAPHPADPGLRDRRAQRGRPAGRLVLRRGAHRRARARGRGAVRRDRGPGRRGPGDRVRLVPAPDRRQLDAVPGRGGAGPPDHRGRERLRGGGGGAGRDPQGGGRGRADPARAAGPGPRRARPGAGRARAWRSCGAPPPKTATSFQPCSIARVPTARCSRSGMCSRRFMAAIGSRSSSDGRRTAARSRRGQRARDAARDEGRRQVAERLARLTAVQPGRAPGGHLLPQARAARPEPREVPHQAQEPGARRSRRRCPGWGSTALGAGGGRARPRAGSAVPPDSGQPAVHPGARHLRLRGDRPVRGDAAAGGAPLPPGGGRDAAGARAGVGRGRVRPPAHRGARPHRRPVLRGDRLRHAASCPASGPTAPGASGSTATRTARGWGEHTYNNRIREEKQRHYEAIARELFAIDRRQPAHGHRARRHRHRCRRGRAVPPQLSGRAASSAPRGSTPRKPRRPRCTRPRSRCGRRGSGQSERDAGARDARRRSAAAGA